MLQSGQPLEPAGILVEPAIAVLLHRNAAAKIATIAVGYADGFIRSGSNVATVWAGETPCPIRGRVSMDLITVDVTHLDDVPDTLDLISPAQTVDALADQIGTIGYEVLTSLGARYERVYEGGS